MSYWLTFFSLYGFITEANYQGVSNVIVVDTADNFGEIGGSISWTLPQNMTNVDSFMPWLGVDYNAEIFDLSRGMGIVSVDNNVDVAAPATLFEFGNPWPLKRIPPWPWGSAPGYYSGDEPLMVIQVHTEIANEYQLTRDLQPESRRVMHDVGYEGDTLPVVFISEEDQSNNVPADGIAVIFFDSDKRCGYLGGALNITVGANFDITILSSWRIDFTEDLAGTNRLSLPTVNIDLVSSVPVPVDFQYASRVFGWLVGIVSPTKEIPVGGVLQDDCGGVPEVAFNISFTDEEPELDIISGTVRIEIPVDAAPKYTSMNFWLAMRADGLGRMWLGYVLSLETQFQIPAGTRLYGRDHLLAYLANSYGEQTVPVAIEIKELITAPPGTSSQVVSIHFTDEAGLYGHLAGLVTWEPGSLAVTEYFVVYVAQNSTGKGQVQVSPEVSVDSAHEWYINVTLDTSGEPYTHLLIYAGNSILMSEYASAIALEDSRITCRNDVYAPCPKGQVLKDEEMLPYGCQGERCTAQECCWDAGTCSDFLNGTNISAQSKGCADGYIALQNPPEFCAGTQCNSSDCCLQTAEAMGSVEIAAVSSSWDSIQVSWTVPTLNDCIFQEYQVQLLAENSSNSTWQDVAMGCSQLRDSCGSSCVAQQLPSLSTFRARARVKCLLVGAQDQEFYSTWTETPQQVTGRQPPSAPVLMPVTVNYETEVLYRWNPLDTTALGPDCTFDSWFVQIREEGLAVWTSVTCGSSTTEECLIQNLKCDTNFEVAVAAICQEANLIGEYSTSSFKTQTGDKCLHPAGAPTMLMITEVGNSMVTITWTTGASMDCLFNAWLVQLRILGAANWESQGCETSSRENSTCTVTGLRSSTTYEMRIQENCNISSTNSEWSNVTLATTSVLPSEAPGITPVVLSPDTVQLSWSAPMLNDCMFSGYQIQWALAAGGAEVWQNTCEAGLSSSCALGCDVTALPTQSLVVFRGRVLCVATEQNSEYNTTSEVLMPGRPMEAPSSVGASLISTYQAFISWSPGTLYDCVFQQWLLELQTDSNTDWEVAGACNITSPTATGCFLQGLPCGTQFRARVRGLCTIGSSSTVEMNFATPLVSGCRAKALAPSLVLASMPSTSTVDLTWQAGESLPNCSFLQWEVQTQPENQATFVATQGCNILTRNVTSCTVTGLQSSTNHSFRVREVCEESSLSSDWALSSSISTLLVPSQAPGNLMATDISSSSISLQWSAASLNDCRFQDYIVRWREGAGNWSTSSGCSVFSSSCESSCVASGLPSNREIQVEVMVQCVSSEADSPWTSVTMQTLPVPAPAVQNLQVTDIFTAGGTLSWNMAAFNDCVISSWLIDFREIFGAWSALSCAEPAVQTTPCGIRGLTCDTSYEVRVAVNCTDPVANGPFTTVSFTTLQGDLCLKQKPAPRFVTASSLGTSSMSVSWVDASDASNCSTSTWQVETRPANSDTWHMVCDQVERNVTSCIASGLQSNTGHSFRVREVCDDVSGSWGNTALTVSTDAKGAASTEVWASSPTVTSMLVQWNSPILFDCGFSSFELQWSVVAGTWQSAACAAVSMCDTSCRVASLPSNTQLTFRVRILCSDQALNSEWSNGSFPMSTLPRPSDVVLSSAVVISHDMANLTWERPTTNDCVLQGYQVELYDGAWRANPTGCVALNEETTDCTLTNLACDTEFQARVTTVCSDTLANSAASSSPSTFRTTAGAECLKRALLPRGLLLMPSSVSTMSFIWEAGDANDCTFASWDVQLNTLDGQIAASCQSLSHGTTSCSFTDLAENTSYVAVVQETCSQPLLSSPLAESSPASTLSVVVPSVQLQLPFPGETLAIRPTELTVMYDVDVELSSGVVPQVCGRAPCNACDEPQGNPIIRSFRLLTWAQNSSFWHQGCTYDVSVPLGFVVTRQKPEKQSPFSQWSFTFQTPPAQLVQLAEVIAIDTENATVEVAWSASVEFRCRAGTGIPTAWQLAPREVPSLVNFNDLLPETQYEIQCMARLQDEPLVESTWLLAGQIQTLRDLDVTLQELYLHVQPLCLTHTMQSYVLPVTPTLQSNRTNYSVALPNADFALNCTQQEAQWQLEVRSKAMSKYATTDVTTENGTANALILTLPANEVLVTSSFTVQVNAGCGCVVDFYHIQVMGLRLSFAVTAPAVSKATGDPVPLNSSEEGHRLEVQVTYNNDALPAALWSLLSIYVGPFQQVTLAAPRPDLQTDPESQVYVLMTTLSAVGKDLPLQIRIAGALVGESSTNISFAEPFVNCISTVGYGQCTTEELEKKEVFVGTIGATMLYVKGLGFGSHETLAGSNIIRVSVTQSFNTTELCEATGWVSNTEMWCRLEPKGASPLEMLLLGPTDSSELLRVPWSIRYQAPVIENFSQPTLQIMDGGQLFIIGQNFPDFQDDGGTVEFEANGSRRLRELAGISTSEVCVSLTRVNNTHLLCDMKSRIDLTRARCTDVDIVVAWGDLTTSMQTVPLRLPSPRILAVEDSTPSRAQPVEVGIFLYRLDGVGFGTMENGRVQVLVGNRSCQVSSRGDDQIFCQATGPLRDDLTALYPEAPENASGGDVTIKVAMPVWITLGSSSIESSEDCKPIAANWSSHEVYLKSCAAGFQRESTRTDTCLQCQPGWYTPVSGPFLQCLSCPSATYAYSSGSTACLECPNGRSTNQNATASALDCNCFPGRFLPVNHRLGELKILEQVQRGEARHEHNHQLSMCEPCPVGATCRGGLAPPVSDPGWWMLSNEVPVKCMMQGCLGNNTCQRGYDQRTRCETCSDQFYPDLQESVCRECESWVLMFGAIYGALSFVALFGCVFPYLSWKARVALDPARGVAPPKLCFGLFHCCLKRYVARRQLVSAEYVDMSLYHDKWWKCTRRILQQFRCLYHSPMRKLTQGAELQPVVNIIINNLQVFFLIANIGYYSWPDRFKEALNFGLLIVMSAESLRPSCVAPIGAEGRWYIFFAGPFALYISGVFFVYFRQRERRRRWRIMLMVSGAFLLYLSPLSLLSASMVFDCVESGANEFVWETDRGMVCWSDPSWMRMAFVGTGGLVLVFVVLIIVAISAYRTYLWYRTAEVGMIPPKAVFFTWWWLSGLRGVSLKHRAAIQGYKVHLDLPKDVTEASEVSSLCDDLLLQNVGNLKSGIERLNDYLQGFRVDDAKDSITRPWQLRGSEPFCEHCQGCGKRHKHTHKAPHLAFCGLCSRSFSGTTGPLKIRSRLRKAAYNRLTVRLEHLLMHLRQMSSFSDTQQSLKDLLSFSWELIALVHKTALGMTRLLSTQHHRLGLQVALLLCIGYLVLSLTVWPYRHNGLNILSGFFAGLNVLCVYAMIQLQNYGGEQLFWNVNAVIVACTTLGTMILVPVFWSFYALWSAAFSENYYVMATQEVQGTLWRGAISPKSARDNDSGIAVDDVMSPVTVAKEEQLAVPSKKAFFSMLTRVVRSPEELLPDEPVAAQWCFRVPLDMNRTGVAENRDESSAQHVDITLEQGIAITVRDPAMLLVILNAEGGDVDFHGKWGLPSLPPCRLRRGGDLPGRLRISVPCSDQKLLRSTLKQLNALSDRTHRSERQSGQQQERDTFSVDDTISPRSHEPSVYSTLSLFSTRDDTRDDTPISEMAPRLSTVTTNTQATQATQASAISQKPGAGSAAFKMKALTKPVKIGGRIVPAGAQIETIRYVPPGTLLEDAMAESPEEFLYRLSRSRFGKGGVLRDAHGVLVLEFQRPDDPLDVQMELAELIISRDEVPQEKSEGGVDAPSGMRTRQKVEWARALSTERAKALVWDVGDFVLPLDLRFTWPVPSLQLCVSPKPDWGCMQHVLVLSRGGQQWILQAQEVHHHLGLAGEVSVKRRRQQALRNSNVSMQPNAQAENSFEMIEESDEDVDDVFEEDMELPTMATVRTGKSSGSHGHFASRSAWRTKSGGVVFIHDFSCFGGTLELVGRPQDIKAVEQGELLGQQVLWHPPLRPRPSSRPGTEDKCDGTCSTVSTEPVEQPMRGWFDGHKLYWEPTPKLPGIGMDDNLREVQHVQETVGIPKDGQLPAGPWDRITSALEPGGIPGPDSGLWSLQTSFYAECYGPLPLEFLEKLGEFQAGLGARELYLRTRRDAMKEEDTEKPQADEEVCEETDESSEEDYTLEALGLVEAKPTTVAFEDIMPTLKRNSQPPRLRTLDS